LQWRKQQPALISENMELLDTPEPILGIQRSSQEQKLVALFNLSPKPIHLDLSPWGNLVNANERDFFVRQYENTIELSGYGVFFGNYS
jgi:alpha-glucosidase